MWTFLRAASLLAVSVSVVSPALAAPDGEVTYTVSAGDTLYDLSQSYLSETSAVEEIRTLNGITNPRYLQIGKQIRVPRRLLKFEPVSLSLQNFKGPVSLEWNGRTFDASVGFAMREGVVLRTGANGFAAIAGDAGTLVTIPSNSRVRIIDARRYLINDKIDVQIKVLEGRGEVRAPKIDGAARFRVGTPVAVTAVRGTEFRVAHLPDTQTSLTEVVEGNVGVSQGSAIIETGSGFGIAATQAGLGGNEQLLAAPQLVDPGQIQTKQDVVFKIGKLDQAVAYRTQLASDAGFVDVLAQVVSEEETASFSDLEDGRYFVRSRAVSQSGLEGFSKVHSFRRKRIGAEAGVEPSPFADAYKFAWRIEGDGKAYNAFQLWRSDNPTSLIVDELGLEQSAVLVGALAPGDYKWRVATFQIDEGEVIKVWGPTQDLAVSE